MTNGYTGIVSAPQILGRGATNGKHPSERRIILTEGETHHGGPGDDKVVLGMALTGNEFEIYSCGSKKEVLETFRKLDGMDWNVLIAVIDRDEDPEDDNSRVVYWPDSRDLEMYLLRSDAFTRAVRELSNNMEWKLSPDVYMDDPFAPVLKASGMAWKIHLKTKKKYNHPNRLVECLNKDEYEPSVSKMPLEARDLCKKLLDCNEDVEFPTIGDLYMENQGKRALTLVAACMFMETSLVKYQKGIKDKQMRYLWKKLRIRGYVSRLKQLIIKNLEGGDLAKLRIAIADQGRSSD